MANFIGTGPNQISLNGMLGNMAFQNKEGVVTDNLVTTNLTYTGTLTGSTDILNIGSGQIYKNANGNVGIGTTSPSSTLDVNGDITVADKIIHGGDINTSIRFPAADTFTVETNGSERFRVTANGNILTGTTIDFSSTTTPGGIATTGLGIYPFPLYSSGAIANNTTNYSGLNQTFSFSGTDGASTQAAIGLVSAPILNNSGAGGTSQTGIDGIRSTPVIDSTGPNARIFSRGGLFQAIRNSSNDTSAHVGNFLSGIQAEASHITAVPNTIYSSQVAGAQFNVSNFSGNVGNFSGCSITIQAGSATAANTNTTTAASAFRNILFNVGATSGGASVVTNGYGINLIGPTVANTGTMTNYYALYAGTPTVTGTLTNRYGVWIDDSLSTNYFAGKVGIGTTSPAYNLDINGSIQSNGTIYATHFDNVSDISLKENINQIINPQQMIADLNPVSYNWKDTGEKSFGLIAQEVEKVIPEIVHTKYDGTKTISYSQLIPFLIACIQDQQKQITELKSMINNNA